MVEENFREIDPSIFLQEEPIIQPKVEEPEEKDEFAPEVRDDVLGLMYVGRITKSCEVFGHSFVLKTLTAGEELAIAQVTKDYHDTAGEGRALAIATLAASIESVDGRPMMAALGPDTLANVRERFQYVLDRWYWPTVEAVFQEYDDLLLRQALAYQALEGKSKAGRGTSSL